MKVNQLSAQISLAIVNKCIGEVIAKTAAKWIRFSFGPMKFHKPLKK